jgi:acetyl-CoA acetyltransferase
MSRPVYVVGVGMTKFEKPGRRQWDYPDMVKEAASAALTDAGIAYDVIEQVTVGYVYGESTSGQRAVYELGLTGVPVYNVNNACATGSTALFLGKQLIEGGSAEVVLAAGFEKMKRGSIGLTWDDRTVPFDKHYALMAELRGFEAGAPGAAQIFGNAGREHSERHGTTAEQFAKVAVKNHRHSVNNPYAQFQDEYTLEQILAAPMIFEPLTKLQCSPTSEGAGAAVLMSADAVRRHGLEAQAIEIAGQAMATDLPDSLEDRSCISVVGAGMARAAAQRAYDQAGMGPEDVQVVELHDCFSTNELITYEALGMCADGDSGRLIDEGETTYGGRWVVNPSGGLISKGHPLGATGLAQCAELNWQLRGMAEKRQVDGVRAALQHNIGLGGAAVVTLYRRMTG